MLIKTQKILEASESALLNFSTNRSLLKPIQRLLFYPLVYLKVGFGNFTEPMRIWSYISFVLFFALNIFSKNVEMYGEGFQIFLNIYMWGVLLLITFQAPSTYAFYGSTDASVNRVVEILNEYNVQSERDVKFLECNIEKMEQRIDSRIKFYKWIIGGSWGLYLLFFNLDLRLLSLSGKMLDENLVMSSFEYFLYVALFTTFALIAMISYKRASDMLIANLQFACVEQKHRNQPLYQIV